MSVIDAIVLTKLHQNAVDDSIVGVLVVWMLLNVGCDTSVTVTRSNDNQNNEKAILIAAE